MPFAADFHIHSRYSRATSLKMNVDDLVNWAKIKGVKVLGSGDFTHPLWLNELREKLIPAENGLFSLKSQSGKEFNDNKSFFDFGNTRFILTSEISCIYSKSGKVRKIHLIIFAPSFEAVEKINAHLGWIGNLKSDGRPILGVDAKEVVKMVLGVSENCLVVPAHCWTPWFSVFGSKSGFNSLEECFEEYSKYIYAVETGLSSSPDMNWQLSGLDQVALISNSDSHSPQKIAREANVFDCQLDYYEIIKAIKEKDKHKFLYTIEFFPEEGKYHFDGHRLCNISLSPKESKESNFICPACKKPLTIGVLTRVNELADRGFGFRPENAIPFKSLVPLEELIIEAMNLAGSSKQTVSEYDRLIAAFGNELEILINVSEADLLAAANERIASAIILSRKGKVNIVPGYDGVYGKINIFGDKTAISENLPEQKKLF